MREGGPCCFTNDLTNRGFLDILESRKMEKKAEKAGLDGEEGIDR